MTDSASRVWAVVPAGGSGRRLGGAEPKQFQAIGPRSMLEWSVRAVLAAPWVYEVLVAVAPDDRRSAALLADLERTRVVNCGGSSRRDSVLNALLQLRHRGAGDADWALVHDAARPGLSRTDLDALRDTLRGDDCGGLLAQPVSDTVKRGGSQERVVSGTVDRQNLWLAQTPQMFRFGRLVAALQRHPDVTDESAAIEAEGGRVILVPGDRSNFKVTTVDDLVVMRRLLMEEP